VIQRPRRPRLPRPRRARGPGDLATPGADDIGPRFTRSRLRLCHCPGSRCRWSGVTAPAGRSPVLLPNLRDVSRKWQGKRRDMSRNCQREGSRRPGLHGLDPPGSRRPGPAGPVPPGVRQAQVPPGVQREPCFRGTSPTARVISSTGACRRTSASSRLAWAGRRDLRSRCRRRCGCRPRRFSQAAWRSAAGPGLVSPPPGASRPAAGASPV
jgi:hypothetical protein